MKKSGFTMIELVVSIGLIALIGTLIVANMGNVLSGEKDKQYEEFLATIQNAACTYVDVDKTKKNQCCPNNKCVGKTCSVTVEQILNKGLIEEKDLMDPKTKTSVKVTDSVSVSFPNGVKTCKYTPTSH